MRKQIGYILDNFGIPHRIGCSYYGYYLDFLRTAMNPAGALFAEIGTKLLP
ncbi:MAG: hypothetical protein ACUVTP_04395 [Candidatus Fervidibacter sp.]|uniref:hypothetical protein n=1 Tax=Candidatus Fervidibacter sp. TaxID=3100871 RepID=UPI0040492E27